MRARLQRCQNDFGVQNSAHAAPAARMTLRRVLMRPAGSDFLPKMI
jgi:hypothetical protein